MKGLEMKKCNTMLKEKLKETSTIPSIKIDQREYLTGEKIVPPNQNRVIKEATFKYPCFPEALEKQTNKK